MAVTYGDIASVMRGASVGSQLSARRGVWSNGGVVFGAVKDGKPIDGDPASALLCGGVSGRIKEGDEVICLVMGGGTTVVLDTLKEAVR